VLPGRIPAIKDTPKTSAGRRLLLPVAIACAILGGGYAAIGGLEGLTLLYARYRRVVPLPNRPVAWNQGPSTPAGPRKPNVLVILVDDMGYNDITLNGGGVAGGAVPTPHINSLALDGVNCAQAYAGNATCSPSRAALMTGRYGTRFGFEFTSVPINFARIIGRHVGNPVHRPIYHREREKDVPPYPTQGLPTSEITIAQLLSAADYHTIHLGKWHLGESPEFQPQQRGFAESLGYLAGASLHADPRSPDVVNAVQDFDPVDAFLWAAEPRGVRYNGGPVCDIKGSTMTDYLTDEAIAALEANRNRPFFMYLAYSAPHSPLQAAKSDYDALPQIEDHAMRVYAAMIRSLDRNVGRLLAALDEKGLAEDTLVVFTSDNGGANYLALDDLNKPFRGWKASLFEGGLRTPFFLRWPARLPRGTTVSAPVTHVDIYATAAAAAGVPVPADRVMDGRNLLPLVEGIDPKPPHDALFWRSGPYRAVRVGDWKLQVSETPAKRWLFNLAEDPTEQHDLAESQPEKAAELAKTLAGIDAEQSKPLWPALIEAPVLIDKPMGRPVNASDEYIYWSN
jgi:arylsulfatase A-like enzyme